MFGIFSQHALHYLLPENEGTSLVVFFIKKSIIGQSQIRYPQC
jgi:hypothetical protein